MALDRLTKIDGGGISTTSDYRVGVITATKFVGPIEGTITSTDATFTGNVSIAGTLTYEDVTNVDSVGVITARNGIKVSTGTATTALVVDGDARVTGILTVGTSSLKLDGPNNVVNVGTALTLGHSQGVQFHTQNLHAQGFEINQINASGIITASQFKGDGSQLTGIDATALKDPAGNVKIQAQASGAVHTGIATFQDIDVDGHTNLDNVSIAGVSTFSGDVLVSDKIIHSGDTNTQIRFPANDTITFETGGAARLTLSGGNIVQQSGTLYLKNATGDSNGLKLSQESSDESRIFNHYSGPLTLGTSNTERLRIDSSGRLAFGNVSNNDDYDTNARNILLANESGNFGITIRSGGSDPYAMIHFADGTSSGDEYRAGRIYYHHAQNAMIFATANTERLRILSTGVVTVNTASLLDAFKIDYGGGFNLSIDGGGNIKHNRANGSNGGLNVTTALTSGSWGTGGGFIALKPNGVTNGLHVDRSGRVMVLTDSPGVATGDEFTIASSDTTHTGMTIRSGTSHEGNIFFADSGGGSQGIIRYEHNNDAMVFKTNAVGQERLRIDSNGLIGVNVTPTSHNNTTAFQIHDTYNSQGYPRLRLTNQSTGSTSADGFEIALDGSNLDAIVRQRENAEIHFYTNNTEKLRIESGGGLKFTGQGTSIPVGGILHHTNNNLYVRGGTNGLILGNQDNTNTVQIYNGYIKFETNNGSEKLRINSAGGLKLSNTAAGNLFEYGGSTVNADAAININRYGNGYADIRLSSNYGASLKLAGASNNTDEYVITQDNQKNAYHNLEYDGFIHFTTGNTTLACRMGSGKVSINKNLETLTGNGVNAKLQVNTGSNDYDGIMLGGGYNRSTITTGGNYDLVLTSNAYPANATSAGIRFKCGSSGGGGPNERMRLHQRGILKAHQGVDTQGNGGGTFYSPNSTGYVGTQFTEQGAGFVFYMGELVSSSSSNASTKYVTVYTSHHWGDYPRLVIWAHHRYYQVGFTCWTFGAFGGSSPAYNLTQTESWGGSTGGHGTNNAGSISVNHRGPVATYSGSQVHAYELTMSNTGTYSYVRWYVGVMRCGRGIYTSDSTVSNVDASTSGGGCVHLHTISNSQMEPINYLTA